MVNVANTLPNSSIVAHFLVLSRKKGEQWTRAAGLIPNPNTHVQLLGNGKWEDWDTEDARELVGVVQSPEFSSAVEATIIEIKAQFPQDKVTAVVFNPLMAGVIKLAKEHNLKIFGMIPTPYYMMRISTSLGDPGVQPQDKVVVKDIGCSGIDMIAEAGDVYTAMLPMREMVRPLMEQGDGLIFSNTNVGLEGNEFEQKHLPFNVFNKFPPAYMIGPILPSWYEEALDKTAVREVAADDECIKFMSQHPPKSVVYVALGSHVELTIEQAEVLIKALRRTKTPWVLLQRVDTAKLKELIGLDSSDGVVTAWAPQLDVLIHPSLKCVVSHGGFGTMIEGVYAAQPFITSPVMSDQFIDTKVMQHLGICVGSIAENHNVSVFARPKQTPFWTDDGGASIYALFDRVFGTPDGEAELETARKASRVLRQKLIDAKASTGAETLDRLRRALSGPPS
jgi:hypothetical protein